MNHPAQQPISSLSEDREHRCQCGNLLARLAEEGVELKCRRCKRTVIIPWRSAASWHDLTVRWQKSEIDELSG